jgi:hypothetical protein
MLLHINPTRQRGKRTGSLARASGWYMTFFAAGVIVQRFHVLAAGQGQWSLWTDKGKGPGVVFLTVGATVAILRS